MKTKSQTNIDRLKDLDFRNSKSKHAALTRLLENHIRKMRHGERVPVVRDLMNRFKVSQSTVEHALHTLESRNLITRRWGSGIYVNRQGIRRVIRRAIGVVVPDITVSFYALLVKGLERKLAAKDHVVILCNGHRQFQAELETIHALHGRIDGAIISPNTGNVHNPKYVRYFSKLAQSREFPFLLVDIMIPGVNAHFAGFDNFNAFFEMACVLAGSRTPFRLRFYLGSLESIIGAERISGFKAGLNERHVSEESFKIINVSLPVPHIPMSSDDLRCRRPVLMVAGSPLILFKLLAFCSAHKLRIPEDVIIAGVLEENFHEYIHAPILGWVKPAVRLGELSARIIQDIIVGKPVRQINKIALERFMPKSLQHIF